MKTWKISCLTKITESGDILCYHYIYIFLMAWKNQWLSMIISHGNTWNPHNRSFLQLMLDWSLADSPQKGPTIRFTFFSFQPEPPGEQTVNLLVIWDCLMFMWLKFNVTSSTAIYWVFLLLNQPNGPWEQLLSILKYNFEIYFHDRENIIIENALKCLLEYLLR